MSADKRAEPRAAEAKLTAYLQVLVPAEYGQFPFFGNRQQDWERLQELNRASERGVRETLHELESLSGRLEFALGKHGSCRPEIRVVPFPEEEYETDDFGPEHPQTREGKEVELLRIGASVPDPHEDKWERVDYLMSVGARFTKQVHDLVLAANIARPGSVEVGQGVVFVDGTEYRFEQMGKGRLLRGAWVLSELIGWPKMEALDLSAVWDWANRQEGFVEGFGGGPTGRALNAFGRLFGLNAQDDAPNLFWALVGIEALYTEGQGSLQQQVKEKSQVFLGRQEAHRKRLTRMYDFRSRLVHGDLDFSGRMVAPERLEEVQKHDDELLEAVFFAEAILVTTLQRLAGLGWSGLRFSTQVEDRSKADASGGIAATTSGSDA